MQIKKLSLLTVLSLALAFAFAVPAHADTITGDFNGDNHYTLYLSTSPTLLGTQILQSDLFTDNDILTPHDWETSRIFLLSLTDGLTYYLHIVGLDDTGIIAGVLANVHINGFNFTFDNGLTETYTGDSNWQAFTAGPGTGSAPFVDNGSVNGSPWTGFTGNGNFNASSRWIWTNQDGQGDLNTTRYFSVRINSVVTPEPVSSALFLLGGSALAARRLRKKNNG